MNKHMGNTYIEAFSVSLNNLCYTFGSTNQLNKLMRALLNKGILK